MTDAGNYRYDPRPVLEFHFRHHAGIPPDVANQLLNSESYCISQLTNPNPRIKCCALDACLFLWQSSNQEVLLPIILPLLSDERNEEVLRRAIWFAARIFFNTQNRNVIVLLLDIAQDTILGNEIRNMAYEHARKVDFGLPFIETRDDSADFETEEVDLNRVIALTPFDEDYINSFYR